VLRLNGSSPRVRGTLHQAGTAFPALRFIPACAGNTTSRFLGGSKDSGSSPRVRGTLHILHKHRIVFLVHPRVCGEHSSSVGASIASIGSSPRVRGTRSNYATSLDTWRFIPACAGNTQCRAEDPPTPPVHPRVCGEHFVSPFSQTAQHGSSPRVRGTRPAGRRVAGRRRRRFIPACAGNTGRQRGAGGASAVHPRVCGEHRMRSNIDLFRDGSSPRVRGTPIEIPPSTPGERFIPACAGNTPGGS